MEGESVCGHMWVWCYTRAVSGMRVCRMCVADVFSTACGIEYLYHRNSMFISLSKGRETKTRT